MRMLRWAALGAALLVLGLATGGQTTWTSNGVPVHTATLQNAAASGNGTVLVENGACHYTGVYVTWSAGTSAGVVTIETAPSADYAGTWDTLGTVSWATASTTDYTSLVGAYTAIRARISTGVVGGTVTVTAVGS